MFVPWGEAVDVRYFGECVVNERLLSGYRGCVFVEVKV